MVKIQSCESIGMFRRIRDARPFGWRWLLLTAATRQRMNAEMRVVHLQDYRCSTRRHTWEFHDNFEAFILKTSN
jgi:hypothetical protein